MNLDQKLDAFFTASAYAVVGASNNPAKYGLRCYQSYLENGLKAYPVNRREDRVLGNQAYKKLAELPETCQSISIITPPPVTEMVVEEAIACGVKNIWMQPGAESAAAVKMAEDAGLNVISGGPCLMVVLSYRQV